jgi:CheY-like chemotaxis protein
MKTLSPLSSVLVIDDVDATRSVLCDMLRELGFSSSVEAKNGREALEKLRGSQVELILCDNVMDEMDGVEFLRALRSDARHNAIPVIFVSAVGDVPRVEEAIVLGATDYLVKPVSFRKLRRTIDVALGRTRPGSAERYEITP